MESKNLISHKEFLAAILRLESLPPHHGDPFDRLLIAQAINESLPILTQDEQFRQYPVKLIW